MASKTISILSKTLFRIFKEILGIKEKMNATKKCIYIFNYNEIQVLFYNLFFSKKDFYILIQIKITK